MAGGSPAGTSAAAATAAAATAANTRVRDLEQRKRGEQAAKKTQWALLEPAVAATLLAEAVSANPLVNVNWLLRRPGPSPPAKPCICRRNNITRSTGVTGAGAGPRTLAAAGGYRCRS